MRPVTDALEWLTFIRGLAQKRWVRYVVAGVFLLVGISMGAWWVDGVHVHEAHGTIVQVKVVRNPSSGEYEYHLITLSGHADRFNIDTQYFTPSGIESTLTLGTEVDVWYSNVPLLDPDVIALQAHDNAGGAKYVTRAYTDPTGTRSQNLWVAAIFFLTGLVVMVLAILAPVSATPQKLTYGELVVGPSHSRRKWPGS